MTHSNEQAVSSRPTWVQYCIDYCTTGNIFAKLGVVFLFIGFIFLLSYTTESGYFPIKWRLISTGGLAVALLVFGWVLRNKKRAYSLALDGAGFGLAYIILFMCTPHVYHYLSSDWALGLMAGLSLVIAVMAFSQDAPSLISLAQLGGFLAPILSGYMHGNVEFLFTYYLLLNISIAWIAWYKSWGALNFIGFLFTFILSEIWVINYYEPTFAHTIVQVYLILFTLLYTFISVMSAFRSNGFSSKYFLDTIVLLGMPLVAFVLECQLLAQRVHSTFFGFHIMSTYVLYALYALLFAAYYAIVMVILWGIKSKALAGIRSTYLYISITFIGLACLLLAMQYGLDVDWPLLTIAILSFISLLFAQRFQEKPIYLISLILNMLGTIVVIILGLGLPFYMIFALINSSDAHALHFIVSGLMSSAILLLANSWVKNPGKNPELYQPIRRVLAIINFVACLYYSLVYYCCVGFDSWQVLYIGVGTVALMLVNRRQKQHYIGYLSIIFFVGVALKMIAFLNQMDVVSIQGNWSWASKAVGLWVVMSALVSWIFMELRKTYYFENIFPNLYLVLFVYALIATSMVLNMLLHVFGICHVGYYCLYLALIVSLCTCFFGSKLWLDAASPSFVLFARIAAGLLCIAVSILALLTQFMPTHVFTPIYLPIINSTDLLSISSLALTYVWFKENRSWLQSFEADGSLIFFIFSIICLVCLSGGAVRAIQHWVSMVPNPNVVDVDHLQDMAIQATLTILWGLVAFTTIIVSNLKHNKKMWWSGMALLGIVILKLLIIDMYNSNTLERIISFLGIAVLLLILGYFSPAIPAKNSKNKKDKEVM